MPLKMKTKTEFFTKNASHAEWIEWLDKREALEPRCLVTVSYEIATEFYLGGWQIGFYATMQTSFSCLLVSTICVCILSSGVI